jgi:hypothetical protein
VCAAVLNAHPIVSGLDHDDFEIIRASWQQFRHPDLVQRTVDLEKARVHVERGGTLLIKLAAECYSQPIVDAAAASAAAPCEV